MNGRKLAHKVYGEATKTQNLKESLDFVKRFRHYLSDDETQWLQRIEARPVEKLLSVDFARLDAIVQRLLKELV